MKMMFWRGCMLMIVTGDLVLPRFDCCACTLYGSMYCALNVRLCVRCI